MNITLRNETSDGYVRTETYEMKPVCGECAQYKYRWIEISYDPEFGLETDIEAQTKAFETKKLRILDSPENYKKLLESKEILDWNFIDDDPSFQEIPRTIKFSEYINFKEIKDILVLSEIIWTDMKQNEGHRWKFEKSGFTNDLVESYNLDYDGSPMDAKVWPLEMNIIKDILVAIGGSKNPYHDWITRITNALHKAIETSEWDSFGEFIGWMYKK